MTSIRLLLALVIVLAATPLARAQDPLIAALKDASSSRVLVAAHRGAHDIHPENSLPAIERAITLGVDIVEIDVRLTKDGVPVLMHDRTVDRTTTGSGAVSDLTFDAIRRLKLKDATGVATDLMVPTLAEALTTARGRILVDLDLKTADIEPTISRVIETGTLGQALFFNGDYDHLKRFLAIAPATLVFPRAHSTEEAGQAAAMLAPEAIHIDEGFNTEATHQAAMSSDSRMWINALGEPDQMVAAGKASEALSPLLAHGASIIQTDYPAAIIAWLESIGRR